jgi:Hypervirulence associated proteins TUDOR domain
VKCVEAPPEFAVEYAVCLAAVPPPSIGARFAGTWHGTFGDSVPGDVALDELGFAVDKVCSRPGAATRSIELRIPIMTAIFMVGGHLPWNSEAGHVCGKMIKVHTKDADYKRHTHHASLNDPRYETESDKTDHSAMHKGEALKSMDVCERRPPPSRRAKADMQTCLLHAVHPSHFRIAPVRACTRGQQGTDATHQALVVTGHRMPQHVRPVANIVWQSRENTHAYFRALRPRSRIRSVRSSSARSIPSI